MLLLLAAMGTMSYRYHTLITALQIKSSIHHICMYNCTGSIHKWHEHLKHQYQHDFSFNSILLLTTFYGLHPAALGLLLVTAHQLQLILGQIVGQIYSSSISSPLRGNHQSENCPSLFVHFG